jgi:hypothetical protein
MSFELIGIPVTWFKSDNRESVAKLTRVINKSYDKVRFKYGRVGSQRIRSHVTFLADLGIDSTRPFVIFLFLGPADVFELARTEGFKRDFSESFSVEDAFDCDVVDSYATQLNDRESTIDTKFVRDDFAITADITNRILGTIGFKKYGISSDSQDFELTTFTSFLRSSGPKIFHYIAGTFFAAGGNPKFDELLQIHRSSRAEVRLHATIIKDHNLIPFYTNKCGFLPSSKPDVLIKADEDSSPDEIKARGGLLVAKSFHFAFLYKDVQTCD